MKFDFTQLSDENQKKINNSNNQRIFFITSSTQCVHNLTNTEQIQATLRCGKCGIPLRKVIDQDEQISVLDNLPNEVTKDTCKICRREKLLNKVLVSSYVFSALIFVMGIVGVILRELSINFVLLIGCLEIIFLLFWGRFLEEAVFFGLSQHNKLLSSLYRYSVSAEIQNFDVALKYLSETKEFDDELLKGFLQVTIYQAKNIPTDWFHLVSEQMSITQKNFIEKLSEQIDEENELHYLDRIILNTPPSGISLLIELLIISNNLEGLSKIADYLESVLSNESLDTNWLREFYIFKQKYFLAFETLGRDNLKELIEEKLSKYKEPKVPTIDVIESGKGIIQKNPFLRYLIRIFFYIGIAFLLGIVYRFLE